MTGRRTRGRIAGVIGIAALLSPALPAFAEHAHYDIDAAFDPDGCIVAVVTVRLPNDVASQGVAFLLGRRFAVDVSSVPHGAITIEETDKPLPYLQRIAVRFADDADGGFAVTFRYSGPLNAPEDAAYPVAVSDGQIELRGEMAWYPIFHDFNTRFAVDAVYKGVPDDYVAVAPGEISREKGAIRVRRRAPDIDAPFVAARGLARRSAPGIAVYARDFDWPITSMFYRHALGAAAYFQSWFGPLPETETRVIVLPASSGSYATRGHIVTNESRAAVADSVNIPEEGPARLMAHEFAHAWWAPVDLLSENRWLAESVAEFLALRYVEAEFGLIKAQDMLERKRPRAEAAGPVIGAGRPGMDTVYHRGPSLLFELERIISRAQLDETLRRLAADPPRETADFLAALEDVAGTSASESFKAMLSDGPGAWREVDAP